MKLTRALQTDLPQLIELLGILFQQEAEFEPNPEVQRKGLSTIIGDSKVGVILVARDDDRVIGMVSLLFTESTALGARVALLEDMVVSPQNRGQRVGALLMDYAICEAQKEGCKRITLLTDIQNVEAQKFYERQGFVKSAMTPYRLLLG
jgi:GNAT superfamily N-acetyltransferase